MLMSRYSNLFVCMLKGLTEPDYGSDASALRATATKVKDFNLLICFFISVKWYYHALLVFGCHGSDHAISCILVLLGSSGGRRLGT